MLPNLSNYPSSLPSTSFAEAESVIAPATIEDCPICLLQMSDTNHMVITACKHNFHETCLTTTLALAPHRGCPACRSTPTPVTRMVERPLDQETNPTVECEFIQLVKASNLDMIKQKIAEKPEWINTIYPTVAEESYSTLSSIAAKYSSAEVMTFLIEQGMDINQTNQRSTTPLMCATQNTTGNGAAYVLLDAGADTKALDKYNRSAAWYAASGNNLQMLQTLLTEHRCSFTDADSDGYTPLGVACYQGHTQIATHLIDLLALLPRSEREKHLNAVTKEPALTALSIAAQKGHEQIVYHLLINGANPNLKTSAGNTALIIAAEKGYLTIAEQLISKGANINTQNNLSMTALCAAAKNGHTEIVELLLRNGANKTLGYRESFFHSPYGPEQFAADHGHFNIVQLLRDAPDN